VSFLFCGSFSAQDFIFKRDKIFFGDKELTKNSNFRKVFGKPDRTESNDRYEEFYYDDLQFSYLVRTGGQIQLQLCDVSNGGIVLFKNGVYFNNLKIEKETHLYELLRVTDFLPYQLSDCDGNSCFVEFKSNDYRLTVNYGENKYSIWLLTAYL
jgi:hypothetical protein